MIIKIRHNVFETNSSSTHAISISSLCLKEANKNYILYDSIIPNESGQVILTGGTFGWQWKKYNDAITKANYCAEFTKDDDYRKKDKEMLCDVIKEQTGAKEIIFDFDEYSVIDHQSEHVCEHAFSSKEKLKQFIFNKNSWLYLGHDGCDYEPPNFYDNPNTEYSYEIRLDYFDYVSKLEKKPNKETLKEKIYELLKFCCHDKSQEERKKQESLRDSLKEEFEKERKKLFYEDKLEWHKFLKKEKELEKKFFGEINFSFSYFRIYNKEIKAEKETFDPWKDFSKGIIWVLITNDNFYSNPSEIYKKIPVRYKLQKIQNQI